MSSQLSEHSKDFFGENLMNKIVQESHEKNDLKCTKEHESRICSSSLEAHFIAITLHHPLKVCASHIYVPNIIFTQTKAVGKSLIKDDLHQRGRPK